MKTIHCHFTFLLLFVFAVGCGGNASVTGKVTLTDGTPVTVGDVIFKTSDQMARGKIQADGTYALETGGNKGVPPGTYMVSIGVSPTVVPPAPNPAGGPPVGRPQISMPTIPFAEKYRSPATSGLTCEVKGRTTFNITLEPPER